MVESREFRRTLGRFATGVTVVTMRTQERSYGITVNAFMSVSLEPPLIAVCIDKRSRAHATLLASERFGVSILRADQETLSDRFAGRPVKSADDPFVSFHDFPVVRDALAHLVCGVHDIVDVGDHSMIVGEVEALWAGEGRPLLYFEGEYARMQDLELTD